MLENVVPALAVFMFIFLIWFVPRCKDYVHKTDLYQKIGWIAVKRNPMYYYKDVGLRNEELTYYIIQEQQKLSLPEQLKIDFTNEIEKKNTEEILTLHKNEVIKSYFSDFLAKSKNIRKLNSLEYYFYSLHRYIDNELNEYKSYQDKIYSDVDHFEKNYFRCILTDFGRTYYKLYLITLLFIEKNEKTKMLYEYIDPKLKDHITEHIEKNEVVFWSYRP